MHYPSNNYTNQNFEEKHNKPFAPVNWYTSASTTAPFQEWSHPVIPKELQVQIPNEAPVYSEVHDQSNFVINQNVETVEDDIPLLDELGIYPHQILDRMKSVIFFSQVNDELLKNLDLCGPLCIIGVLGFLKLLAGKIHFNYIYGLSVFSGLAMCLLLNLMSTEMGKTLHETYSVLGYGLIPIISISFASLFLNLKNVLGFIICGIVALWCAATASRFFEYALQMKHQRFLIAYPILLLYGSFVLIIIF